MIARNCTNMRDTDATVEPVEARELESAKPPGIANHLDLSGMGPIISYPSTVCPASRRSHLLVRKSFAMSTYQWA